MKNTSRSLDRGMLFIASVFLLLGFAAPADAVKPDTRIFVQLVAPKASFGNIGGIDEQNFNDMTNYFKQKGVPFSIYNPNNYFYLDGTDRKGLFGDIGNFLQTSTSPVNMIWRAGHGTEDAVGGWGGSDNVYNMGVDVGRQEYFAQTRKIADQLGKDVIIVDHSCGSGACVHAPISDSVGGHLKGVITSTGKGETSFTGTLESLFRDGVANGAADGILDGKKDNKVTLGELAKYSKQKGYAAEFAGDMNTAVTYESDHPELAESVCEVLGPALDGPGVDDALAERMSELGYNETVEEQKAKFPSKADKKVYFFVPDATNIKKFLDGLPSNAKYDINGLPIPPDSYGIGKTILLASVGSSQNGSAYFKATSGDQCAAEPIKFERADGGTSGGNGLFGNNVGGALGTNSLLPLLMQGLLGQGMGGFGGQGGYGNQNQYGGQYGQQYQDCSRIAESPVCGSDGQAYKNLCYLQQQGVQLRKQGLCVQATSTPTPKPTATPNVSNILNQVSQSGIPSSMLEFVRNAVSSLLSNILSGGAAISETVVR